MRLKNKAKENLIIERGSNVYRLLSSCRWAKINSETAILASLWRENVLEIRKLLRYSGAVPDQNSFFSYLPGIRAVLALLTFMRLMALSPPQFAMDAFTIWYSTSFCLNEHGDISDTVLILIILLSLWKASKCFWTLIKRCMPQFNEGKTFFVIIIFFILGNRRDGWNTNISFKKITAARFS